MKVTVVGAGAVGATCADNIARKELCDELVLLDIKEGLAEGKALDMTQTAALLGFDTNIIGSTNDYSKTAGRGADEFCKCCATHHCICNDLFLLLSVEEICYGHAVPGCKTNKRDHGSIAMTANYQCIEIAG